MYKTLFIDEEKEQIDDFKDYIEDKDLEGVFEVLEKYPLENLEKMVSEVIDTRANAVVTDFMLNQMKTDIDYNVPYNGVQLVQKILEEREDFPCFVLTSYDDDAVNHSQDVNKVYVKGILHGKEKSTGERASFLDRIKNQIIHYQKKIKDAEARLLELIKKSQSKSLDAYEEEEIIHLDSIIEKAFNKKNAIPKKLRERKESDAISKLLKKVDALAKKLESKNG